MKILHAISGALRGGQIWSNWKPRFRWTGQQFIFEYWNRHRLETFELEKGERKVWCIIVDAEKHDLVTIKKHLEQLT